MMTWSSFPMHSVLTKQVSLYMLFNILSLLDAVSILVDPDCVLLQVDGDKQRAFIRASDLRTLFDGNWLNDQVNNLHA